MPVSIGDQLIGFNIATEDFFILQHGDTIFSSGGGILTTALAADANISVHGNVFADLVGIQNLASDVEIRISETGYIESSGVGVFFSGNADGSSLVNYGTIVSYDDNGVEIQFDADGRIGFQNFGTVQGELNGAYLSNAHSINTNHGTITGKTAVVLDDPSISFLNHGVVEGIFQSVAAGGTDVSVGIFISEFASAANIANYGTISSPTSAIYYANGASLSIANHGDIWGNVVGESGISVLNFLNTGSLDGDLTVGGDFTDTVDNSGTITGSITFSDGANHLSNSGTIHGDVIGGSGNDTVLNTGVIQGDVALGFGANTYEAFGIGLVMGTIVGSGLGDAIVASKFSDRIDGAGGNDVMNGGAGLDVLTGGTGADTFVYALSEDADTITDFGDGADQIDLTEFFGTVDFFQLFLTGAGTKGQDLLLGTGANFGNADSARVSATAEQIGDDTVLTISSASSVLGRGDLGLDIVLTLEDVTANALTVDDFIF